MLRDRDLNLRIEEVLVDESSPSAGKEIRAMGLEDMPGVLLLAVRSADGTWEYNPSRSDEVASGNVLIFLGSPDDSRALRERLGARSDNPPSAP